MTIRAVLRSRLPAAQELARLGSWKWDIRTDVVEWSDELYRQFGLRPQEFDATYREPSAPGPARI